MKYYKKLIGDRIYLAPINPEDVELFTKWMNDMSITNRTGRTAQICTLKDEEEWFNRCTTNNEKRNFEIVLIDGDVPIGTCSLNEINNIDRTSTVGIMIGEQDYRGNGYGTETLNLLLDYGFNYLNLNNIALDVYEFNERAIKCYKKVGFKEYGVRRKAKYVNGEYQNVMKMDILKEEFTQKFIRNNVDV